MFPEYGVEFSKLEKETLIDDDGDSMTHVAFCMVVMPFVYGLLKKDEDDELRKAFAYFEKMAADEDHLVTEVVEFSILEDIVNQSPEIMSGCKRYLGEKTLSYLPHLANFMDLRPFMRAK